MSQAADPLEVQLQPADRLNYATGLLLDAVDFRAEQSYHRGRLARALTYLHGHGTVAGLRVEVNAATGDDEELEVRPGLALDRLGRVIEIPADACIRLDRWYRAQPVDDLIAAVGVNGIVVDVFATFVVCERGKTPAFAAGPFDALDAVVASRLRDYYRLDLVIRKEAEPPLPEAQWPDFAAITDPVDRREAAKESVLDAWKDGPDAWTNEGLAPLQEHVFGQDPTAVLLARVTIPATEAGVGERPVRTAGAAVQVDNNLRPFVFPSPIAPSFLGLIGD